MRTKWGPPPNTFHIPAPPLPPVRYTERDVPAGRSQHRALWSVVLQYTGHPLLVDWAARFIAAHQIPEREPAALTEAFSAYVQTHIKFFRERPERFASPLRTLTWRLGDCDDKTILLAALLRSFRITVRAKFLDFQTQDPDGRPIRFSHVYPEVRLTRSTPWAPIETIHPWPVGRDPVIDAAQRGLTPTKVSVIGP